MAYRLSDSFIPYWVMTKITTKLLNFWGIVNYFSLSPSSAVSMTSNLLAMYKNFSQKEFNPPGLIAVILIAKHHWSDLAQVLKKMGIAHLKWPREIPKPIKLFWIFAKCFWRWKNTKRIFMFLHMKD